MKSALRDNERSRKVEVSHAEKETEMALLTCPYHCRVTDLPGSSEKRLTGNGGKLNTSQAEPVAANSWAVGQFPSISCEAFL